MRCVCLLRASDWCAYFSIQLSFLHSHVEEERAWKASTGDGACFLPAYHEPSYGWLYSLLLCVMTNFLRRVATWVVILSAISEDGCGDGKDGDKRCDFWSSSRVSCEGLNESAEQVNNTEIIWVWTVSSHRICSSDIWKWFYWAELACMNKQLL